MAKTLPLPLPFGEAQRTRIGLEAARSHLSNRRGSILSSLLDWTAAVACSTTPTERTKNDSVDVAAKVALWKDLQVELAFDEPKRKAVLLHAAAVLAAQGRPDEDVAGRVRNLMEMSEGRKRTRKEEARRLYDQIRPLLPDGLDLLEHQKDALLEINERDYRLVVHDDLGLGKTIEVLTSLLLLTAQGSLAFPVLIGCQTSMVGAWAEHAEEWLGKIGPRVTTNLGEGANVVVLPYGRLLDRWKECKEYDPTTIILDESHYLKNPETQRAKAAILSSSGAKHVLCTTATMDPNGRPEECYLQLKLCDRSLEWREYRYQWCGAYKMTVSGDRKVWNTKGISDPVNFGKLLHKMSFRRTKAELGKDLGLPELSRFVIPVQLSVGAMRGLDGLKESVVESLRKKADELRESGKKIDELRADRIEESAVLAATTVLRAKTEELKIPFAVERAKELLADGHRVVLFSFFPATAIAIYEALSKKAGIKVLLGTADLDADQRTELVKEAEASADAISLTYAYCEGITLVSFDRVLVVGRHWIPDKESQAEARIDRIGQKRTTAAEYLIARNTIDEAMVQISVTKETGARSFVGSTAVRVFEWLTERSVVGGR